MSDSLASRVSIWTLPTRYVRFDVAWSRGNWTNWINYVRKVAWGCPVPHYVYIISHPGCLHSDECHICHMTNVTSYSEYSYPICPNSGLPGCVPSPTFNTIISRPGAGDSVKCHVCHMTFVMSILDNSDQVCQNTGLPGCVPSLTSRYSIP